MCSCRFFYVRDALAVVDGIVVKYSTVVVPLISGKSDVVLVMVAFPAVALDPTVVFPMLVAVEGCTDTVDVVVAVVLSLMLTDVVPSFVASDRDLSVVVLATVVDGIDVVVVVVVVVVVWYSGSSGDI